MPYKLIKGEFHIFYPDRPRQGPEPDGDTLKFKPDNISLAYELVRPGIPKPNFNGRGMINLRFEGLDALETHFFGGHQDLSLAEGSREFLLGSAGFGDVEFWGDLPNKVKIVENNPVRGYVISNGLDGHGRIVGFIYFGEPPEEDGVGIQLDATRVSESFNANSLAQGQAYPLFYFTLPISLSKHLSVISANARSAGVGLFPSDASLPGEFFAVTPSNYQTLAIWPKLFRRLHSYFSSGFDDLLGFEDWLRANPRDRDDRILTPEDFDAHLHNIFRVGSATTMRITVDPKDVIVIPDDFVMPDTGRRSLSSVRQ